MKKRILPLLALVLSGTAVAQIGIGTRRVASSAQLEVKATNKGVLLPKVVLNALDDYSPIVGTQEESLLVYNTGTAAVPSGFYFWKSNAWNPLVSGDTFVDRKNKAFTIGPNPSNNGVESLIITDTENHSVYLPIAAIANNSTFITTLVDNNEFITKLGNNTDFTTIIQNNSTPSTLTLTDETENTAGVKAGFTFNNGRDLETIEFAETATKLQKGTDSTGLIAYYYISETGTPDSVVLQISQDVINDFGKIITNDYVKTLLQTFIAENTGSVSVSRDLNGDILIKTLTTTYNLTEEIKAKESNTQLIVAGAGVYIYKNEEAIKTNGAGVTINVVSDVQNNFEEIVNHTTVQDILNNIISTQLEATVTYENHMFYVNYNDGTKEVVQLKNVMQANGEPLTTDGVIEVTSGGVVGNEVQLAVLKPFRLAIKTESISSNHIKNGTLLLEDFARGTANTMLATDASGTPYWMTQNDIATTIAVGNGLSKRGNQIELGGSLTSPTSISVSNTNYLAFQNVTTSAGTKDDQVVVLGSNGVLKKTNAAMPRYFYMPATTISSHDELTGIALTGTLRLDLYEVYRSQYGFTDSTTQVRSNPSSTLPLYQANELDYFITYYDNTVFSNVTISQTGVLEYQVIPHSELSATTYMNIVFKVKE